MVSVMRQLFEELPERGWHGTKGHGVVSQEVINGDPLILSDGSLIHCEVAEDAGLRPEDAIFAKSGDTAPLGYIKSDIRGGSNTGVDHSAEDLPAPSARTFFDTRQTFKAEGV